MTTDVTMIQLLKAELFKIRKNKSLYVMLFGQMILFMLSALSLMNDFSELGGSDTLSSKFLETTYTTSSIVILSYFSFFQIILFCSSICDTEHRNNGYKQLFVLPVCRGKIFFSKQILYLSILVVAWLVYIASYYLGALIIAAYNNYPVSEIISSQLPPFFLKVFVGILPLFALQYFLSLYFKKYIVPIAIGIFGFGFTFVAIAAQWKIEPYNPYGLSLYYVIVHFRSSFFGSIVPDMSRIYNAIIEFIAFTGVSYIYFTRFLNSTKK